MDLRQLERIAGVEEQMPTSEAGPYLWTDGQDTVVARTAEEALAVWEQTCGPREPGSPSFRKKGDQELLRVDLTECPETPEPDWKCCVPFARGPHLLHAEGCPRAYPRLTSRQWVEWWLAGNNEVPGLLGSTEI